MTLRLVVFDVDGTLVDSQNEIWLAMQRAYEETGFELPCRSDVLSIVGLSLHQAFAHLSPDVNAAGRLELETAYKDAYAQERRRAGAGGSPLYPGARAALEQLHAQPETLLAVATGKSKRGLDALIEAHELSGLFVSQQTADFHPSKPHPSMVEACLADAGVDAERAVMVGDTRFDMDMARAAGARGIGVSWGYHAAQTLTAARVIDRFDELPVAVDDVLESGS